MDVKIQKKMFVCLFVCFWGVGLGGGRVGGQGR